MVSHEEVTWPFASSRRRARYTAALSTPAWVTANLSLADDLVAVGFAQSSEREEHNRLTEAIQIPHLAGAGGPVWMSPVAVTLLIPHVRYL